MLTNLRKVTRIAMDVLQHICNEVVSTQLITMECVNAHFRMREFQVALALAIANLDCEVQLFKLQCCAAMQQTKREEKGKPPKSKLSLNTVQIL